MDFLKHAPTSLRAPVSRGVVARVIRDGGDSGAGLIRGFAVVTRGEAIGHDHWIDAEFLQQTADAINATGNSGIKSRFTHPNLSGDGLGRFLGRVKNGSVRGDQVLGDLHLSRLAHNTPDGDLAEFVMGMAADEPDMFGTSIVYMPDVAAQGVFAAEHQDKRGRFVSPDKNNEQQFPHARLAELRADDVVDEPAANPGGMFSRGDGIVKEADALLSFALGLSDEKPEMVQLELDPERVSAYLQRFLATNGLMIVSSKTVSSPSMSAVPECPQGMWQTVTFGERPTADEDAEQQDEPAERSNTERLQQRIDASTKKMPDTFVNRGLVNRGS